MRLTLMTCAVALAVTLGACEGSRYARPIAPPPGFGAASAHNLETQVVDPQPAYAAAGAPDFHGKRALLAIDRYETGKVIVPERLRITTVGGGGG